MIMSMMDDDGNANSGGAYACLFHVNIQALANGICGKRICSGLES